MCKLQKFTSKYVTKVIFNTNKKVCMSLNLSSSFFSNCDINFDEHSLGLNIKIKAGKDVIMQYKPKCLKKHDVAL